MCQVIHLSPVTCNGAESLFSCHLTNITNAEYLLNDADERLVYCYRQNTESYVGYWILPAVMTCDGIEKLFQFSRLFW